MYIVFVMYVTLKFIFKFKLADSRDSYSISKFLAAGERGHLSMQRSIAGDSRDSSSISKFPSAGKRSIAGSSEYGFRSTLTYESPGKRAMWLK